MTSVYTKCYNQGLFEYDFYIYNIPLRLSLVWLSCLYIIIIVIIFGVYFSLYWVNTFERAAQLRFTVGQRTQLVYFIENGDNGE